MTLAIRPLRPGDRDPWQRLYDGYHRFYDRPDLPAAFFDAAFARLMSGMRATSTGWWPRRTAACWG